MTTAGWAASASGFTTSSNSFSFVGPAACPGPPDPVALARLSLRGKGLRQTDHVERAVSLAGEFPVVRVVRGGRVVAKLTFDDIRPNYMSGTVEMCAEFAE